MKNSFYVVYFFSNQLGYLYHTKPKRLNLNILILKVKSMISNLRNVSASKYTFQIMLKMKTVRPTTLFQLFKGVRSGIPSCKLYVRNIALQLGMALFSCV